VYSRDVHLMTNTILKRQLRGALVDGPVYRRIFQPLKGVSITEPDPLASFQDDLAVYHDQCKDYATNEPTMDGRPSAILLCRSAPASYPVRLSVCERVGLFKRLEAGVARRFNYNKIMRFLR